MTGTDLNLRHLRLMLAVAQTGSVTKAAKLCHISQPALTQALKKLEARFGVGFFDRGKTGVFPNSFGRLVLARIERALKFLDAASKASGEGLHLTASTSRLKALVEVAQAENFTLAARNLGIAQPTVHRAITQLEQELGHPLFRRTRSGPVPTRIGHQLAQAARLAFAELDQARYEIHEAIGQRRMSMVIGGMPLSRSYVLPEAIAIFQKRYPETGFTIIEGPYDTLLSGLRKAQIDLLVGALRIPPPVDDVIEEHLFDDEMVIVCRPGHPLTLTSPMLEDAMDYPWIVAVPGAPARAHFDAMVARAGGRKPVSLIETSSMILMRELLGKGDYLGAISRYQAESEIRSGLMTTLPLRIADSQRSIGLSVRADWKPTQMQAEFVTLLRETFRADQTGTAGSQTIAKGRPRL